MAELEILKILGISLGLGLLVGMQRERKGDLLAGLRTFVLITLAGTISGLAGRALGAWVVAAAGVGLCAMLTAGVIVQAQRSSVKDIGLTTEVAALVMFLLGAYLVDGDKMVAVVTGGTVALLLHWKEPLHNFVTRMGEKDVRAVMTFVLIALVILPILPNKSFGPYNAINPFNLWLVVVLVVGMSMAGYVVYKLVPPETGTLLGGTVGGLVSSTATTVSFARRTRQVKGGDALAGQAIMIANFVAMVRVIVLASVFAPQAAGAIVPPLAVFAGTILALGLFAYLRDRGTKVEMPEQGNPAELKTALFFAGLYGVVKLGTAWAADKFGQGGLYVVGVISGLTDMDAITLSISGMLKQQGVATTVGWQVILLAAMANLVFKFGCVVALGSRELMVRLGVMFAVLGAVGGVILVAWPK